MNRNYYITFTGIFLALCVILCAGVWYSMSKLYECREEYDQLDSERHNNTGVITSLEQRNANLSRMTSLSINNAATVPDAVAFFSMVRQIMDMNQINLLYMTTEGQSGQDGKDNILKIRIDGNYYAMARMLAGIRDLPAASKITNFSLKRNHDLPDELVEADITFEVMTEE